MLLVYRMIDKDASQRFRPSDLKDYLELMLCYTNALDETGTSPDVLDQDGSSLLHLAAGMECSSGVAAALMAEFLSRTTNVNVKDKNGRTALELAYANQSAWASILVKQLLAKGAHKEELDPSNAVRIHTAGGSYLQQPGKSESEAPVLPAVMTCSLSSPLELIGQLLDNGRDVNESDRSGRTPLHYAICVVHPSAPEIVRFLLDKNASVTIRDELGRTPMHCATSIESNYALEIVKILLDSTADDIVNEKDRLGWTPLHFAVGNQHESAPEIVRFLLAKGAVVGTTNASGKNPLHGATENKSSCSLDIVRLLLDQVSSNGGSVRDPSRTHRLGCPSVLFALQKVQILLKKCDVDVVDAQDRFGRTPLHYAVASVSQWTPAVVGCLMDKGATSGVKDGGGRMALHEATKNESPYVLETVATLLRPQTPVGDNVNQKDNFGWTPLHFAVRNRHQSAPELVRFLIERGESVSNKDDYGRTPLLWSAGNESDSALDIVALLLASGADVNERDRLGRTALHLAVANKHRSAPQIVQLLVDRLVWIDTKDCDGKTPLHWATENQCEYTVDVIHVLFARGAYRNVNDKDKSGLTPVGYAKMNQSHFGPIVLRLLVSRGGALNV